MAPPPARSAPASSSDRPSTLKVWVAASRPHTLTASVAPVLVGAAVVTWRHAESAAAASPPASDAAGIGQISLAFGAFACLIQLGTNLHNDYADFVRGADDESRVGQARATQKGWLTPGQTAGGATACLLLAAAIGLGLSNLAARGGTGTAFDAPMLFVVCSSVFNAVAYTGGPYPLGYIGLGNLSIGYSGLGDVFVFLYFGLVATLTVPYLYLRVCGSVDSVLLLLLHDDLLRRALHAAVPIGNLATAIIVVNNLRDRRTDRRVGKRTLAVRLGGAFARWEYAALVLSSYAALFPLASAYGPEWILPLASFPLAVPQLRAVAMGAKDGSALNDHVGGTARLQLAFCILLVLAMRLSQAR